MRRAVLLTALLALLAGTAHAAESKLVSIRLVSVTTHASVDNTRAVPGLPAGEVAVNVVHESDRLYNGTRQFGKKAKAQVGTDRTLIAHLASGRSWADVTTTLPGGTIRTVGYLRSAGGGEAVVPVVGGTKRYAKVTGWLSIRNVGTSTFAANIYTLRLPG